MAKRAAKKRSKSTF